MVIEKVYIICLEAFNYDLVKLKEDVLYPSWHQSWHGSKFSFQHQSLHFVSHNCIVTNKIRKKAVANQ